MPTRRFFATLGVTFQADEFFDSAAVPCKTPGRRTTKMMHTRTLRRGCAAALLMLPLAALAIPEGPDYPSPGWIEREAANYAKTAEAAAEEINNPAFMLRWTQQMLANQQSWNA